MAVDVIHPYNVFVKVSSWVVGKIFWGILGLKHVLKTLDQNQILHALSFIWSRAHVTQCARAMKQDKTYLLKFVFVFF